MSTHIRLLNYLEQRDPDFDQKMIQVLHVYKQVELIKENQEQKPPVAIISYDEKPGIQAISSKAPERTPVASKYACIARDYEYKRHGTVSFLAGIDLLNGHVHAKWSCSWDGCRSASKQGIYPILKNASCPLFRGDHYTNNLGQSLLSYF